MRSRDELDEERAHRAAGATAARDRAERERARVERAEHELADVQRVALAALGDPAQRRLLDRTAEGSLDERRDGRVVERSSSRRRAPASFHSETIASGQGSPVRTVATTNALPVAVRCSTSAADTGSSSCASSTPMHDLAPVRPLGQRRRRCGA